MFQFLAIAQLFYVYPSRHTSVMPLPTRTLHAAVALGVAIQLFVGIAPGPAQWLGLAPLGLIAWAAVFALVLLSWVLAEALNRVLWLR